VTIKFKDGSFISIDKDSEDGNYSISLCGQKPDGSTTMSYAKLDREQATRVMNQLKEWLEE